MKGKGMFCFWSDNYQYNAFPWIIRKWDLFGSIDLFTSWYSQSEIHCWDIFQKSWITCAYNNWHNWHHCLEDVWKHGLVFWLTMPDKFETKNLNLNLGKCVLWARVECWRSSSCSLSVVVGVCWRFVMQICGVWGWD